MRMGLVLLGLLGACGSHESHTSDAMAIDLSVTAGARVGDPCTATTACPKAGSGVTACRDGWPGGYCVVDGCTALNHDCPDDPGMGKFAVGGGKCVIAPTPTCLKMCNAASDCRSGYDCVEKPDGMGHGSVKVCVPR